VGLNSLKNLNLTNVYPNNKNNNNKKNNKVKSKPLELFELAGKNCSTHVVTTIDHSVKELLDALRRLYNMLYSKSLNKL
jgi:hypothetical protein